eukprot:353653-Prymnesium_polylepis.1
MGEQHAHHSLAVHNALVQPKVVAFHVLTREPQRRERGERRAARLGRDRLDEPRQYLPRRVAEGLRRPGELLRREVRREVEQELKLDQLHHAELAAGRAARERLRADAQDLERHSFRVGLECAAPCLVGHLGLCAVLSLLRRSTRRLRLGGALRRIARA